MEPAIFFFLPLAVGGLAILAARIYVRLRYGK